MSPTVLIQRARRVGGRLACRTAGFKPAKAYWNWLLANWERLRRPSRIRARPLKLTFDPTNYCNLRCPLCPTGLKMHDRAAGHADASMFGRLLEEVGDYVFFIDFFNWGEPLLNLNVEELLAAAHHKAISTRVSTNFGIKLSDDRIRSLIESGLNELIVSLDGASQETSGTYRRGVDFALVMENMRRMVQMKRELGARTPWIIWRYLVFRFNESEMPEAERLAAELGVDELAFAAPYLDDGWMGSLPMPEEERAKMHDWEPLNPRYQLFERTKSDGIRLKAQARKRHRCDWHYISTAINIDGAVAPCCSVFEMKNDFGVLGPDEGDRYMEVVNNQRFISVRDRFAGRRKEPTGLVCDDCPTPDVWNFGRRVNRGIAAISLVQPFVATLRWISRCLCKPVRRSASFHPTV